MKAPKKGARPTAKQSAPEPTCVGETSSHAPLKSSEAGAEINVGRGELGHDPIQQIDLSEIHPSPENERLYRPVRADDPEIIALALSIREHGIIEPLVITRDGFILSGHRRHLAALLAGLASVPCRVETFNKNDDPERFLQLLREYNRQREKSFDEKLREEVITINPDTAYQSLIKHRNESSAIKVEPLTIVGKKHRAKISDAKEEFLDAVLAVLNQNQDFWPLSDRQIHYMLLNDPPLKHSSKPRSVYKNDGTSYKALVELVTRARLIDSIPMTAIADETRPIITWATWPDVRGFVRSQLESLLNGYWRDLMQSQPNHIEILVEKNTVANIIKPVAMRYCIPMTSGRGFCSLPPRHDMAKRFKASGKEKLVVLIASDFDPDGEEIAHSFARSMRDDFKISTVHAVKIALTAEQVRRFKLPAQMLAKETSSNYKKFVNKYGLNVHELEAVPPSTLQGLVRDAIDAVLDIKLFNSEIDREKEDAAHLEGLRRTVIKKIEGGLAV